MPELPEVEILVRHLRPLLHGQTIQSVEVRRPAVLEPTSTMQLQRQLQGATFQGLTRRGKYLLFELSAKRSHTRFVLLGHLGMTGRMFLAPPRRPLPKHAAVVLRLGGKQFIYEDPRYFGRMTLDVTPAAKLGPEPLAADFTPERLARELKRSRQAIKVKLLDQSLVAGIGNIYASEALFQAGISPRRPANRLTQPQASRLWQAIRDVLIAAIENGSTIPLRFEDHKSDGLFYYGSDAGGSDFYQERLHVYDRANQPCRQCRHPIRRVVQAARSTFFCPACQKA